MVLIAELEKVIIEQKTFLKTKPNGVVRLGLHSKKLSPHYVLIITGIRRCGKSTLMQQLGKTNLKQALFLNFEDSRIFGFELADFSKLTDITEKSNKYFFFDEIQNVKGWEVFIRQLSDRQKVICITGSNASLLSNELGTKLTGRNIQIELFPFSFQEYCLYKKCKLTAKSFLMYLHDGGFPDYLKNKQKEYLQQLFKDIVFRDIIVRYSIRNAKQLLDLALYMIANASKEYSLNNLRKTFDFGSTNSVADYMQWLEDAYLLFSVPRFSWSLKSVAVNPKKVYTIDTGFAQANSLSFTKDDSRLFENCIFLELRRKFKEIYYFRNKGECDFIVKEGKRIVAVIQVCTILNYDNQQRELNGIAEALEFFKLSEGYIITLNQKDSLLHKGKKISVLPASIWIQQCLAIMK